MSSSETRSHDHAAPSPVSAPRMTMLATQVLQRLMPRLTFGQLVIETPAGERVSVIGEKPGPQGVMIMANWRALWRCLTRREFGFEEGYMAGDWSTPDVAALLQLATLNERELQRSATVHAGLRVLNRLQHWRRDNTKRGSRKNIAAHYDLGNAFYEQWLDPGMTYSSALYSRADQSLEDAQTAKIDNALALMELKGGERVLEIGCGWGSVAERLASQHRCHVTGLTLSSEQLAYTRNRLARVGVAALGDIRLQDYRDVREQFDRVISIEMIEAVGERYWPTFFSRVHDCLKPGGIAVIQGITIDERRYESYRAAPDFIQRYIFPGGMLPTVAIMRREIERAGLTLVSQLPMGDSYARTLAEWQTRFQRAWPDIAAQGFNDRFKRMWEYYLAYCEIGFGLGVIDVAQYQIRRTV